MKRVWNRWRQYAWTSIALLSSAAALADGPLLGFYAWDAPDGPNTNLDVRATWLGVPVQLGQGFTLRDTWASIEGPGWQLGPWRNWVLKDPDHRKFLYTVSALPGPTNDSGPDGWLGTADDVSLAACANGDYNSHWKTLADHLVAYQLGNNNTILRFGHEFSGNWFAWGVGVGAANAYQYANFANCFKQFVTTIRTSHPEAKFEFDWNPIPESTSEQLTGSYPGDEYVDYVSTDSYDADWDPNVYPYPADCDAACRLTRQQADWANLLGRINNIRDFAKLHGKKMGFAEWGVWNYLKNSHGGGDNPYYIMQMYKFVTDPANNVGYQVYFDVKAGDGDHQLSNSTTQFPQAAAMFLKLFGKSANYTLAPMTVAPTSVPQGQSLTFNSSLAADSAVGDMTVTLKIVNSSGQPVGSVPVAVSLATANQAVPFSGNYVVPANLPPGDYHVAVSVMFADGSKQVMSVDSAVTFTVTLAPPAAKFVSGSATPSSVEQGKSVAITASISANQTIAGAHATFNVVNSSGQKIASQVININLNASNTTVVNGSYAVPANLPLGNYHVSMTVHNSDWSKQLVYKDPAASFTVVQPALKVTFNSGSASPASVQQGQSVAFSASVSSNQNAPAHATFKVLDANNQELSSQNVDISLSASSATVVSGSYVVPANLPVGNYHVAMAVNNSDSSKLLLYQDPIASFSVVVPPLSVSFGSSTASPTSVTRGQSVTINTQVTSNLDVASSNISISITNSSGKIVAQKVFSVALKAGQPVPLSAVLTIGSSASVGMYQVTGQVLSSDWSKTYKWQQLLMITVR